MLTMTNQLINLLLMGLPVSKYPRMARLSAKHVLVHMRKSWVLAPTRNAGLPLARRPTLTATTRTEATLAVAALPYPVSRTDLTKQHEEVARKLVDNYVYISHTC